MQFDEIRSRIEVLCKLAGWSNEDPLPNYAFLANEGLRLFTQEAQHNVEDVTITTVANQVAYAVSDSTDSRGWVEMFDDAAYGTTASLYQTTRANLRSDNRLWRQAAAGTPQAWYWASASTIGLYPKPSASGTSVYFQGVRHEPILDADSDTPLCDEVFHEGICLFGAWHFGKLYARGESRQIAEAYRVEAVVYADRCKASLAGKEAGQVIRRVSRSSQEYLGLGPSVPANYY